MSVFGRMFSMRKYQLGFLLPPLMAGNVPMTLSISSNTNNVNLFSLAGSPSYPVDLVVTIQSGIIVGSTSTGSYAFDTGTGWASGSTLTLINLGNIVGRGGAGGKGGNAPYSSAAVAGADGGAGGPAFNAQYAISIDNGSGLMAGAGGGGGGGGGAWTLEGECLGTVACAGGAGGGSGRGCAEVSGGGVGTASGGNVNVSGLAGYLGNFSAPGGQTVGADANDSCNNAYRCAHGGTGAAAGQWGASGSNGTAGYAYDCCGCFNQTDSTAGGGTGGAAGACTNGNSIITWLSTGARYGALN